MSEPARAVEGEPVVTLPDLALCFLQIALSSFGGGLSAWTQRIVVERRRWLNNEQFLTAITISRLFPGPNQVNMAIFVGEHFRGLPGALAALAGLLLAPIFTVYPQMGVEMILLAFIVVILGGMGSMGGSVIAAFVIGVTQSLFSLWMNPQRVSIAIFGIMILVLIVRPRGFLGREGVLE